MGLGFPPSLSPSSVSAFKDCPLAFKFSYIDRLPEPPSAAATKGTLVHKALEILMCRPQPDRTVEAALADLERAEVEMADGPALTGLRPARRALLPPRGPPRRTARRPRAQAHCAVRSSDAPRHHRPPRARRRRPV